MPLLSLRALTFLLVPMSIVPAFAQTGTPDTDKIVAAQRAAIDALPGQLAALPARCTLGNAHGLRGKWMDARRAAPVPNQPAASIYTFEEPLNAHAFHAALNAQGWRDLEMVESRDAHGNWHPVWSGKHEAAPAGCDFVRFEQAFEGGTRDVAALRFTLRLAQGTTTTAFVGVLQGD
jgi:hypothetical protein